MVVKVHTLRRLKIFGLLMFLYCFISCGKPYKEKFSEAMTAGNLTEAQEYLTKIEDRENCEYCAKQLIQAYLEVNASAKAVHVYENITFWHAGRDDLDYFSNKYEKEVCKLLREYLMRNGEYDKALNYYPITYDDENYIGNAKDRFSYLSDVVAALCVKGKQEEARKFIEYQLRWFVINVDSYTSTDEEDIELKNIFSSSAVRTKLLEQIDNSYL